MQTVPTAAPPRTPLARYLGKTSGSVVLSGPRSRAFFAALFSAVGVPVADDQTAAEVLVEADFAVSSVLQTAARATPPDPDA
jgi:hypothetical protein